MKQQENPMYSPENKKYEKNIISHFRRRGIIISPSEARKIQIALNEAISNYTSSKRENIKDFLELRNTNYQAARRFRNELVDKSFALLFNAVESFGITCSEQNKARFKSVLYSYFRLRVLSLRDNSSSGYKLRSKTGNPITVVIEDSPEINHTINIELVPANEPETEKNKATAEQPELVFIPEEQTEEFLRELYKECEIPVLDEQQVWLIPSNQIGNTTDMFECGYVALSKYSEVYETAKLRDGLSRNEFIRELNSEFRREDEEAKQVNYIGSQLYDFLCAMRTGDYVVAYSEKNKDVLIGVLGEVLPFYYYRTDEESAYLRRVKWIDKVCATNDIYLFNELSGRRVIANISYIKDLVFRNIYPMYVFNNKLYLNLKKTDHESLSLAEINELQNSILECTKTIANAYDVYDEKNVSIRMAVASPGPVQLLFELRDILLVVATVITVKTIYQAFKGKKIDLSGLSSAMKKNVESNSSIAENITGVVANVEKITTEQAIQATQKAEKELAEERIRTEKVNQEVLEKQKEVLESQIENEKLKNRSLREKSGCYLALPNSVLQDQMIQKIQNDICYAGNKANIKPSGDTDRDR